MLRGVTGEIRDRRACAVRIGSPKQAKTSGIGMALIPEDRKTEGLMLPMTVGDNLSFAALRPHLARRLHRSTGGERARSTR